MKQELPGMQARGVPSVRGGHSCSLRAPSQGNRCFKATTAAAVCLGSLFALNDEAAGQQTIEAYWVNDGLNDTHDPQFGEFGPDLGGAIEFGRYGDTNPLSGHLYARNPPPGGWPGGLTFQQFMYERLMDFDTLLATLVPPIGPAIAPLVIPDARAYPGAPPSPLPGPLVADAWFTGAGGAPQQILYWPLKINGGALMVCMGGDGSGRPIGGTDKSLLVYNYYNHPSSFGSNKNRFGPDDAAQDGWPREYARISAKKNAPFAEAWFEGYAGTPWLGPKEQAIASGDIVVFVQENYGMSIATSLFRNQEAVWWVRNVFAASIPGMSPPITLNLEGAYLHGVSFGQAMSAFVALAQPQYYRGVVDWITSDLGFELGDFSEMQWHLSAGLDIGPFMATTDNFFPDIYALVDQLGIRFDAPMYGQSGWDLAAFSLNRRPLDVKIPLRGHVGEHERQYPGSWSAADPPTFASAANSSLVRYRNRAHEEAFHVIPGLNEYAIYNGNEWQNAKNSNPPASINRIVPAAPAPAKPYPDPYSHTLRPSASGVLGGNLLTHLDARAGMDGIDAYHGDGYRHPAPSGSAHPIKSIGHGIMPGYRDQMRVADLDADGEMEVIFGNLDGYVHILEFAGNGVTGGSAGNIDDPYRLVDEWQSPRLGLGVFACDGQFSSSGLSTVYFADARGQVWKISATGPNTYTMAGPSGAPVPLSDPIKAPKYLYDGSTPLILAGDFDGGSTGGELLVLNRFWDWGLLKASDGTPLAGSLSALDGRLQRSTRTNGPTDAFAIDAQDLDPQREVIVSSVNGGIWLLNRVNAGSFWKWEDPTALIGPSACSRVKAVPCFFNGGATPTHLLSFCVDDDRDDAVGGTIVGSEFIELYAVNFSAFPISVVKVAEASGGVDSFAWIDRPKAGSTTATFATSGGGMQIATYQIDLSPAGGPPSMPPTITQLAFLDLALHNVSAESKRSDRVTSIDCAPLEGVNGGKTRRIVLTTSKGRIHVLSHALAIQGLRASSSEYLPGAVPPVTGYDWWSNWPSNRSLSQIAACDLVQPEVAGMPLPGQGNFYFAEYTIPMFSEFVSAPNNGGGTFARYRVGRLGIGTGPGGVNEWEPYLVEPRSGGDWEGVRPNWTRALSVDDFVDNDSGAIGPDGELEFRVFTETGVAFVGKRRDPIAGGSSEVDAVREFQTSASAPRSLGVNFWVSAIANQYPTREQLGGRVFEVLEDRRRGDYWHLSGFTPPPDPNNYFFDNGGGGAALPGWWYPRIGAILDGQIASNCQSAHELSLGCSMKVANIRSSPEASTATPHVLVGTTGGYVFAILPTVPGPVKGDMGGVASQLRHRSTHLGIFVNGLAAGNLDGDIDDEIVCGTWMDAGTYQDWDPLAPDLTKNRAHLHVFDPVVTGGTNSLLSTVAVLDGDDLAGPGRGIGAGVTGVRIDDVDGDGEAEIWCSDAAGYIYLFGRDSSGTWRCAWRSDDLCAYPGFYNNLHPIKGEGNVTTKLVVQSPGYFFVFSVDPGAITTPWWSE